MGIKITDLPSTSVNNADYIPVANKANGTRKVMMADVLEKAGPTIDSTLSILSQNPVQNKVVATALAGKLSKAEVDATLSVSGAAADAKATGDAVEELKGRDRGRND